VAQITKNVQRTVACS